MIPFPPVVEPDLPGAFITVHPRDVKTPHAISISWMAGLTADEGAMKSARKSCLAFLPFFFTHLSSFSLALINLPELTTDLNKNWEHALSTSLYLDHHDDETRQNLLKNINEVYFNNRKLEFETQQNLTNVSAL